jgi:hypothetical protein
MTDCAQNQHDVATGSIVTGGSKWFWLRTAVSTFFGLLTMALCVLWVRSYFSWDVLSRESPRTMTFIGSASGRAYFTRQKQFGAAPLAGWRFESLDIPEWEQTLMFVSEPDSFSVAVPYRLLATTAAISFALPWFSIRRFSLRTLLIAATLVAVVLGLAVWPER